MATMFPADVTSFLTTGEEATYSFLQRTARPDGKFLCWYAPDIEEREPDFILLSPDCGLVVLEGSALAFQKYQSYTQVNVGYMPFGLNQLGAIFTASEPELRLQMLQELQVLRSG